MTEQKIPQLTELGEKLAKDPDRKVLEGVLAQLPEEESNPQVGRDPVTDSKNKAVKSARHILNVVWGMQNVQRLHKLVAKK